MARTTHVCLVFVVATLGSLHAAESVWGDTPGGPSPVFAGHASRVTGLAFSADAKQLLSVCARELRISDASSGQELDVTKGLGGAVVAFSADKLLAVAGRELLTIHEVANGKQLLAIDPHGDWDRKFPFRPVVVALAFSPDGKWLATAGSVARVGGPHGLPGGVVTIWDAKTGAAKHRFDRLSTSASSVAFSPEGTAIATGTNGAGGELPEAGEVWVWSVNNGSAVGTFKVKDRVDPGEFASVADVAFSPDGKRVAAAVSAGSRGKPAGLLIPDQPAGIRIWELASGRAELTRQGLPTRMDRIAFSPDGKLLAVAGADRTVRTLIAATGEIRHEWRFDVERIDALAFSPDGRKLAAGGGGPDAKGRIQVWSVAAK